MPDREPTGTWKNIVLTSLLTGFVAFWVGYGLSHSQDKDVLNDHELRLRAAERTIGSIEVMRVQLADIKIIVQRLEERQSGNK